MGEGDNILMLVKDVDKLHPGKNENINILFMREKLNPEFSVFMSLAKKKLNKLEKYWKYKMAVFITATVH